MDTVTYPNNEVITFMNSRFVAHKLLWNSVPQSSNYSIKWTPTLIVTSHDGREHHRMVGYLNPQELIPSLLLGSAKYSIDRKDYQTAQEDLEEIMDIYPRSSAAPEAVYFLGTTRYRITKKPEHMKKAHERLVRDYPDSPWTKKSEPYK